MSARNAAATPPEPLRKRTRLLTAVLCALLLAATGALLAHTFERRRDAAGSAHRLGLVAEEPAVLATLGVVRDDDDASTFVAEALLGGQGVRPMVSRVERARSLVLESVADRPGSAYYLVLLARSAPSGKSTPGPLWQKPLALAARTAPGLDAAPEELAARYLSVWPSLQPGERARASSTVERALRNPSFVRETFSDVLFALGPEGAVRLLPSDSIVLQTALEVTEEKGDARGSGLLRSRLRGLGPASRAPQASRSTP